MSQPDDEDSAEDRLIAKYFRPLATHPGAFGLRDDAAAITPPPGCDLVLTTDGIIGGVHFFDDDPPEAVAKKALRINLSDLAAKGATPFGFLMALALRSGMPPEWLQRFTQGLGEDAAAYGCPLLGGDTDKTPGAVTVYVTALGTLPHGAVVHRSGARPGDVIVVTGTIGDAALGLLVRQGKAEKWGLDAYLREHLTGRYLLPQPRNALAEAVRRYATAAMDVSDGLAGDLAKLCRASGVAGEVAVEKVPLSDAARAAITADPASIKTALTGGDDFEIVATVDPSNLEAFQAQAESANILVTAIGTVAAGKPGARFRTSAGDVLAFERPSYSHF
jgi:thiamine-monophosphate kinase